MHGKRGGGQYQGLPEGPETPCSPPGHFFCSVTGWVNVNFYQHVKSFWVDSLSRNNLLSRSLIAIYQHFDGHEKKVGEKMYHNVSHRFLYRPWWFWECLCITSTWKNIPVRKSLCFRMFRIAVHVRHRMILQEASSRSPQVQKIQYCKQKPVFTA